MGPIELEILAPMVVALVLIITVGGVVLLRPLSRRLGDLLEAMAQDRRQPQLGEELERVREQLDTVAGRLTLLEERQDFTDALVADPERRRLRSGGSAGALGGSAASSRDRAQPSAPDE